MLKSSGGCVNFSPGNRTRSAANGRPEPRDVRPLLRNRTAELTGGGDGHSGRRVGIFPAQWEAGFPYSFSRVVCGSIVSCNLALARHICFQRSPRIKLHSSRDHTACLLGGRHILAVGGRRDPGVGPGWICVLAIAQTSLALPAARDGSVATSTARWRTEQLPSCRGLCFRSGANSDGGGLL